MEVTMAPDLEIAGWGVLAVVGLAFLGLVAMVAWTMGLLG